ncbi:MAG: secretin N-terminal domain-containing protein, partial [Myxococcota bacterium]
MLPLVHADARSVATAINEAFRGEIDRGLGDRGLDQQRRSSQVDQDGRRDDRFQTVTIPADEWVRASAEPLTNSVVVSASRQKIEEIERIVTQLDQPDFAKLPPPQIIPVTSGNPEQIATALKAIYEQATDGQRQTGRKALRIVGDKSANVLIVRADEAEFAQIKALAETIQQQATAQGVSVRVITLKSAPAHRIAAAITDAFKAKAQQ